MGRVLKLLKSAKETLGDDKNREEFPGCPVVKELLLSLLWHRFDPWPTCYAYAFPTTTAPPPCKKKKSGEKEEREKTKIWKSLKSSST